MVIKNKIDSIKLIKQLNLNRFPERLFIKYQEQDVVDFLEKYPTKYYAIRDRSKSKGVFKLSVEKKDVLNEIKEYTIFSINVNSYNYVNN